MLYFVLVTYSSKPDLRSRLSEQILMLIADRFPLCKFMLLTAISITFPPKGFYSRNITVSVWNSYNKPPPSVSPGQCGWACRRRWRPRSWQSWWMSCWGCELVTTLPWPHACSSWPWQDLWMGSRCGSLCGWGQIGRTWVDTGSTWTMKMMPN